MDCLSLTVCGHVGKVQGLATDKLGRDCYRFSLACNFERGKERSTLWLQCNVINRGLLELVAERGIYTSEKLLVMCDYADLNAVVQNNTAKSWLNVYCNSVVFLAIAPAEPLQRLLEPRQDAQPNVIDYQQFMKQKVG